MSRLRVTAPATGAAFFLLSLLLLPAVGFALPAGMPMLSAQTRAALSSAAGSTALEPWQRQFMRSLATPSVLPMTATRATGADGAWSELPPPTVEETPAVYDPTRQSMLLFGGRVSQSQQLSNDVWELSLAGPPTWTKLATTGTPPSPRSGHVLLFDSRRERLLLFGGTDSIVHNDCWALDLTVVPAEWGQGFPTGTPPSRRAYCQAVYDSLNDRAIVFGGADSIDANTGPVSVAGDLWELPLTEPLAWAPLAATGTPPSPRAGAAVVYDPVGQRMVLFSGYDGNLVTDAFTLSLGGSPAWADLGATGGPPPARAIAGVVYEAPQNRMVIYGGLGGGVGPLGDVWALDLATTAWTELTPTGGPPSPRQFPSVVYDAPRDRMVVVGGSTDTAGALSDPFWSLSLGPAPAWTDLGGHRPPSRWSAATVVDPTRQVMWVHGGDAYDNSTRSPRTDLWALSMTSPAGWSQPTTTGTPLGRRIGHTAVYDALRDRLVFFGGSDTLSFFNDVWVLTLSGTPAWSQLSPSGTPPDARMYHSAVYDSLHDRMVVFGGFTGSGPTNDVWALSFAGGPAWSTLTPTGTPPPALWGQSAELDRDANRLIVFGGESGGVRNDVHALTLDASPAWSDLAPAGTPPDPRLFASMVSLGTRMIVFGGTDGGFGSSFVFNDAGCSRSTRRPRGGRSTWDRCCPRDGSGPAPASTSRTSVSRSSAARARPSGTTRGSCRRTRRCPRWSRWPARTPSPAAWSWPGRSRRRSHRPRSTGARATARGPRWARCPPTARTGSCSSTSTSSAGARYGYRLGLPAEGGETFVGEVWVDVPEAARLALHGMTPNPGPVGEGLVRFALPDGSPARLEVMDVSGRRVFAREVGSLGAGEHVVRLGGTGSLAPGLYLLRLTQGGRTLTAKAVTTR